MIDIDELLLADASTSNEDGGTVYIHRASGKVYVEFDTGDNTEPLPDDIKSDDYIVMPSRVNMGLTKHLAIGFAKKYLADDLDYVYDIFRRKGAFSSFKSLLRKCNMLEHWHKYEEAAEEKAVSDWFTENGLVLG